jgi:7,8-dihydropterin-6-yl-methyl-4-(beta-D-ribofuranosyl)aminobenzene 5'-phosphate synthase
MQVTLVYDNEVWQEGLEADWGFACLVQEGDRRMLFDTGAQGAILLHNLEKLNLDPGTIPEVFISHRHWDHIGGLADLLKLNPAIKVYLPHSCPVPPGATQVVRIQDPYPLQDNIFSTGELPGKEQSLVVQTGGELVVICGCSHPGVGTILQAASRYGKVRALIGGLHGFKEFDLLGDLKLVCPCHCTQYRATIMQLYPETAVPGGAGKVLVIE